MADTNARKIPEVSGRGTATPVVDWGRKIQEMISNTSGIIIEKQRQLQSLSGNLADDSDAATQSEMHQMLSRELSLVHDKRNKLTEALNRVATGDFGMCDECGVKIPIARLEHRPESPYCVACMELIESKQRHYRQRTIA